MTRWIGGVALVGVAVAGYLTYVHFAEVEPLCTAFSDCARVQASEFSTLAGVPVALIGLLAYVAVLGSLLVPGERGSALTAVLAFTGLGYSLYLTYVEVFRIDAVCQWCVVSAVLMAVLAVLAGRRVLVE